ncbi:unnamed protein product, partial [Vitis vinifera]|uniref:Uncharacterized protein n=1 Tax=Vitis vinifera TaxID=29760 RepID=D7TYP0_VITVI
MFPNSDKTDNKGKLVGESSESKHSTLPEARESPAPALVSYYQRHTVKDSTKMIWYYGQACHQQGCLGQQFMALPCILLLKLKLG